MGLQPPSKLSTTDGGRAQLSWQRVPDNWSSDVEAPLAELSPGPRDHHVMTFGRTEVCPTTDVSDRLDYALYRSTFTLLTGDKSMLCSVQVSHSKMQSA